MQLVICCSAISHEVLQNFATQQFLLFMHTKIKNVKCFG